MRESMQAQQEKLDSMSSKLSSLNENDSLAGTQQNLQVSDDTSTSYAVATEFNDSPMILASENTLKRRTSTVANTDQVMKHIDDEFSEAHKTMTKLIADKLTERKMSLDKIRQSICSPALIITENDTNDTTKLNIMLSVKMQRIRELELEIDALNNRVTSIESSLARWIFRACDYKADLEKAKEASSSIDQELADAKRIVAYLEANLSQVSKELEAKTVELSKYLCRQVSDKQIGTDRVSHNSQEVQTIIVETRVVDVQTDVIYNTTVIPTGVVAQQAAKLNTVCFNELLQKCNYFLIIVCLISFLFD